MALNNRKITTYANPVANIPDNPNMAGWTAARLKAAFDAIANEEVKTAINGIIDDIIATTDGASGADNVGATSITDLSGTTVQGILESLRNILKSVIDGASGADFVSATSIDGLSGITVQALLESLKSFLDTYNTNHKKNTSTDHDNRYYTETEIDVKVDNLQDQVTYDVNELGAHKNTDNIVHPGVKISLNPTDKTKITAAELQTAIDQIENEIKQFIGANANAEVADARISTAKNKTFPSVRDRLEESEAQINDLDAQKATQINLNQTNDNIGITNIRIDELILASGDANVEVTDAHVSTTKNDTFTTVKNRFEEIEADTTYRISNALINGGFESDFTNWINSGNLSIDSIIKKSGLKSAKLVCDGTATDKLITQTFESIPVGNKVLLTAWYFIQTYVAGNIIIFLDGTTYQLSKQYVGTWQKYTKILTKSQNNINDIWVGASNTPNMVVYFDDITVIDITKIFGANPYLEEIDAILPNYPTTFFDGKINFVSKELIEMRIKDFRLKCLMNEIKNTKQNIVYNPDGSVNRMEHKNALSVILRKDVFTYTENTITEVRTFNPTGDTLTYIHHLDTLETEVI